MAGASQCLNCHQESNVISQILSLCASCIKKDFEKLLPRIEQVHAASRARFNLPEKIPQNTPGISCDVCINACRMADGETGYYGLRKNQSR